LSPAGRIMSLHKSNGLTSPAALVVGALEGIVPTLNPRLDDPGREAALKEQRRLLFVAIT
jgi:superfamily I DNA/RNA helicase